MASIPDEAIALDPAASLPALAFHSVLAHLDAKPLALCALVNKEWGGASLSPDLWERHCRVRWR